MQQPQSFAPTQTGYGGYDSKSSKSRGAAQITCGILSISLFIAGRVIGEFYAGSVGHGIWCGIMFIGAGAVAIAAASIIDKRIVIASTTCSIVAACCAGAQIIVSAVALNYYGRNHDGYIFVPPIIGDTLGFLIGCYVINSILIIIGLTELGNAIPCAVLGGRVLFGTAKNLTTGNSSVAAPQNVYFTNVQQQQSVPVVATAGPAVLTQLQPNQLPGTVQYPQQQPQLSPQQYAEQYAQQYALQYAQQYAQHYAQQYAQRYAQQYGKLDEQTVRADVMKSSTTSFTQARDPLPDYDI